MKILDQANTRELDRRTVNALNISSTELMEKAVYALYHQLLTDKDIKGRTFYVLSGSGNNGGDGVGLAGMLAESGHVVHLYHCAYGPSSVENEYMRSKLPHRKYLTEYHILSVKDFPTFAPSAIIIDALFGNGINRPAEGLWRDLIRHINDRDTLNTVISIDLPSGLHPDKWWESEAIRADLTYVIGQPRKSFFFSESASYTGDWKVIDIGLVQAEAEDLESYMYFVDRSLIKSFVSFDRNKFSHKGTYGHALLINGSYGKMGAAILAARSCLRSGVGLLTCHVPKIGYPIMQISVPEAMVSVDDHDYYFHSHLATHKYSAIGIGSGIDHKTGVEEALLHILKRSDKPLILDADALNIIASKKDWMEVIPRDSILTPHPGEFRRLFGEWDKDEEKLEKQRNISLQYSIYIILKGAHTSVSTPDGNLYFNSSGNPGMATAGSGDTLTGILTSFRAQGIPALQTCLAGVYIHGRAGDIASRSSGQVSLTSSDIIQYLGSAFLETFF